MRRMTAGDIIGMMDIDAENAAMQSDSALSRVLPKPAPARRAPLSRDELKAKEWAEIAVQYHQKAAARGIKIPFPDLCFCIAVPHKHGDAPDRRLVTNEGPKGMIATPCPVISKKTHALRVWAMGEALRADTARVSQEIVGIQEAQAEAIGATNAH